MLHLLKRHPFPVEAWFRHSLVLTYALPADVLRPLLPPGLVLDELRGLGFLAVAMVQTTGLRPVFAPRFLGRDFFLTGYRIFARYRDRSGRLLRGLRILRSDTDRRLMCAFGNLLTHYRYEFAEVRFGEGAGKLEVRVTTRSSVADVDLTADLVSAPDSPPAGSPFVDLHEARLYAGPLPFTFDYERETHSLVLIEGVRRDWKPMPVRVEVRRLSFLDRQPFKDGCPVLANAFHVANIPYQWKRGVREPLEPAP